MRPIDTRILYSLPAIVIALCALLILSGCKTRATFADGSEIVLSGRAEDVKFTTPGGSLEIASVSHAEETRAVGEMVEQGVKPIARAYTFGKLFDAAEGITRAALDRSEAGDRITADQATDEAALDAAVREQEIKASAP